MLDGKDLAYRHGEDADFEAELALDKRIHDYVKATPQVGVARGLGARFQRASPENAKRRPRDPCRPRAASLNV